MTVLHQCNVKNQKIAEQNLKHIVNSEDIILFYGKSHKWLNNPFIEICGYSCKKLYSIDYLYPQVELINYDQWMSLICSYTIHSWK